MTTVNSVTEISARNSKVTVRKYSGEVLPDEQVKELTILSAPDSAGFVGCMPSVKQLTLHAPVLNIMQAFPNLAVLVYKEVVVSTGLLVDAPKTVILQSVVVKTANLLGKVRDLTIRGVVGGAGVSITARAKNVFVSDCHDLNLHVTCDDLTLNRSAVTLDAVRVDEFEVDKLTVVESVVNLDAPLHAEIVAIKDSKVFGDMRITVAIMTCSTVNLNFDEFVSEEDDGCSCVYRDGGELIGMKKDEFEGMCKRFM